MKKSSKKKQPKTPAPAKLTKEKKEKLQEENVLQIHKENKNDKRTTNR